MKPRLVTRGRVAFVAKTLMWAAIPIAALTAYPLYVQYTASGRFHGPIHDADAYASDLLSFIVPRPDLQALSPQWLNALSSRFGPEQGSYIGLALIVLLGLIAWLQRRRLLVRWVAAFATAMALLSMGPHLHVNADPSTIPLPGLVLAHLPVLDNLIDARLTVFVFLAAAVLIGSFPVALSGASVAVRAYVSILGVLAALELLPTLHEPAYRPSDPPFFHSAIASVVPRQAVALVLPFPNGSRLDDPLLWQVRAGFRFRMVDGYFIGPDPNNRYGPPRSPLVEIIRAVQSPGSTFVPQPRALRSSLAAAGVRYVIVGPGSSQEWPRILTSALGSPETCQGEACVWRRG
jgi:dolichyl-phosphate beta-glucosyltransferase